jgi:hypothetical protein
MDGYLHIVNTRLLDIELGLQVATLFFTTALLSNTSAQPELRETILSPAQNDNTTPGLLSQLMNLVDGVDIPIPVRVEAWNTLSAIARHHFAVIHTLWPRFDTALATGQDADDSRVRTAGLLFLEEFAKSGSSAATPSVMFAWIFVPLSTHVHPCAAILTLNIDRRPTGGRISWSGTSSKFSQRIVLRSRH